MTHAGRWRSGEQTGVAAGGGEHHEEQGPNPAFRAQVERGDDGAAVKRPPRKTSLLDDYVNALRHAVR
jgi:hypothetical protein